jgi:hypothetical protein
MCKTNGTEKKLEDNRPTKRQMANQQKNLIRKHYKEFVKFVNDIPFENLNN